MNTCTYAALLQDTAEFDGFDIVLQNSLKYMCANIFKYKTVTPLMKIKLSNFSPLTCVQSIMAQTAYAQICPYYKRQINHNLQL